MSAALVLGGVDFRGPHLFTVYPHGSTDALPYATMGSGSLNAMAVFEDEYKCASAWAHHQASHSTLRPVEAVLLEIGGIGVFKHHAQCEDVRATT